MKIQSKNLNSVIKENLELLSLILLYGVDDFEIIEKRDEATQLICGSAGREEMRVNRISESNLLKDAGSLAERVKTISFFPGKQVLIIEGATDKLSKILIASLKNWVRGDTVIILTASSLKSTSSLRKMVESHSSCICSAIYEE